MPPTETNWDRVGKFVLYLIIFIILCGLGMIGWAFVEIVQWITSK